MLPFRLTGLQFVRVALLVAQGFYFPGCLVAFYGNVLDWRSMCSRN